MRKASKVLCVLLVLAMVFGLAACGKPANNNTAEAPTYTLNLATTALGNNWNPHTWETNADDAVNGYITSPFVTMSIKDSKNGVYQWVYEMATAVTDVTATHQADLDKYGVNFQDKEDGTKKTAAETTDGYVYEIKLNPNAKWANGNAITADDYIYSMQELLNPKMHNYRANLYVDGESAVAGAAKYYNSEAPIYTCMAYTDEAYDYDIDKGIADGVVYINVNTTGYELYSMTLSDLDAQYNGGANAALIESIKNGANAYGYTKITDANKADALKIIDDILAGPFGVSDPDERAQYSKEALFVNTGVGEKFEYDVVGCYKVDDYTINYVNQNHIDINYFLTSLTSTWLVYKDYYEAGKDTSGELITTNYGTKAENTMAYGPYMLESVQTDKQMVFVQNPNWYGWEKGEDGTLVSYTNFEVDGKKVQQYRTTKIVLDVMDQAAQKQAFLKGEISSWEPNPEDLVTYASSDQLYKMDETYTWSFFFNTNPVHLQEMDNSKGNTNSIVLSNVNFRKGFSLAIDRAEWVTATPGYKPAFALMNNLYYYNIYEDPTSSYRGSDQAKKAIVNLYGIEYGDGKAYKTLDEAHESVNGYNLTEAKALMKTACDELVAAGLYKAGDPIKIRMAYKKGALDSTDQKQAALMTKYINAAAEGSGFGTIELEPVGSIEDRYGAVPAGEFAIGCGAWGGAAFYPFRNMQVYCDPDQYSINEAADWDPKSETLTININGEDVTMTWQAWSGALVGSGVYAGADFETKLNVTATMEEEYLKKYYRIPVAGYTACELLSFKHAYYTDEYNIMYDFGGLRLMSYNYNDAEWADFVKAQGGELHYE